MSNKIHKIGCYVIGSTKIYSSKSEIDSNFKIVPFDNVRKSFAATARNACKSLLHKLNCLVIIDPYLLDIDTIQAVTNVAKSYADIIHFIYPFHAMLQYVVENHQQYIQNLKTSFGILLIHEVGTKFSVIEKSGISLKVTQILSKSAKVFDKQGWAVNELKLKDNGQIFCYYSINDFNKILKLPLTNSFKKFPLSIDAALLIGGLSKALASACNNSKLVIENFSNGVVKRDRGRTQILLKEGTLAPCKSYKFALSSSATLNLENTFCYYNEFTYDATSIYMTTHKGNLTLSVDKFGIPKIDFQMPENISKIETKSPKPENKSKVETKPLMCEILDQLHEPEKQQVMITVSKSKSSCRIDIIKNGNKVTPFYVMSDNIISSSEQKEYIPICVSFEKEYPSIGENAKQILQNKPEYVIYDLFKLFGTTIENPPSNDKEWSFKLVAIDNSPNAKLGFKVETFRGARICPIHRAIAIFFKAIIKQIEDQSFIIEKIYLAINLTENQKIEMKLVEEILKIQIDFAERNKVKTLC